RSYAEHYAYASQFQGAEMIARQWGITRADTDRFGLRSQTLANQAWKEGRFTREVQPIEAPELDAEGKPTGATKMVTRDEGQRGTWMERLAARKPVEPDGVHTAGTSSQVSDGAAAVLLASPARAKALRLTPRARIVTTTLVGVDPVTMLTGPIPATRKVL